MLDNQTKNNVHYNNNNMDRLRVFPLQQRQQQQQRIIKTKKKQRRFVWLLLYTLACIWSVACRQAAAAATANAQQPPVKKENGKSSSQHALLLLTTADGHLYFLNAWTGEFQTSCKSGAPLVTRSVAKTPPPKHHNNNDNNNDDDDDDDSSSAMIVIPGLDGKLYWHSQQPPSGSGDDALSQPPILDTDLSIPHLLEHPVRSCNSDGTNCGILSAVAHTTLFGIDTDTGSLVWSTSSSSTSTNGGDANTNHHHDDDDASSSSSSSKGSSSSSGSGSTVVLQRTDYWIRHISTATGKQLWNVTLGTYQALDFDSAQDDDEDEFEYDHVDGDDDNDDDGNSNSKDDPWLSLPSTRRKQDKKETIAYLGQATAGRRRRKPALPALFFAQGGRQLAAVDPLSSFAGTQQQQQQQQDDDDDDEFQARGRQQYRSVLWRIQAPHIVTSVFGIHQGRWKALTVLDEADVFPFSAGASSSSSTNNPITLLQLPSEPYNNINAVHDGSSQQHRLLYHAGQQQQGRQYSNPMMDFASAWMRQEQVQWTQMEYVQNEQHHQRLLPGSSAAPNPYSGNHQHHHQHHASRSSYCVAITDADGEYSYHCPSSDGNHRMGQQQQLLYLPAPQPAPPRSTIIFYAEGLLLSWTMVGIVLVGLLVLAVAGRFWYKRRKQSWLVKAAQVRIDTSGGGGARSNSIKLHRRPPARQLLQRCKSEPDTFLLGGGSSYNQSMPRLRPQSTGGADDDDDDDTVHSSPGAVDTAKTAGTAPPPLVSTNTSSEEGVAVTATATSSTALVVVATNPTPPPLPVVQHAGGIPLVRYSRYASEFIELKALGKGGFGSVFSCKNNLDGRDYAIKKVCIRGVTTDSAFQQRLQRVLREVKILAVLDHASIVRYYTAWLELQENDSGHESTTTTPSATTATLNNNNKTPRCYSSSYLTSTGGGDGDDDTESECDRVGASYSPQRRLKYKSRNPLDSHYDDDDDDSMPYFQRSMMFPRDIPSEELGIVFENSSTEGDENENDASTEAQEHNTAGTGCKNEAIAVSSTGSNKQLPSSHLSTETSNSNVTAATPGHSKAAPATPSQRSTPPHANGVGLFSSSSMNTTARSNRGSHENDDTNGGDSDINGSKLESSIKLGGKKSTKIESTASTASASSPTAPTVKHTLYIQMQLCSGHTISDYLSNPEARRGSMNKSGEADIPAALRLFLQVAQAVHHVHEQGLIHRDLKPSNCFMLDSGIVKVGDFGLSRGSNDKNESSLNLTTTSTPDATTTTKSGDEDDDHTAGIGTRLYASPEQTNGSNYDSSTDVYSLGIMLFELCYPMYTGMERNICLSKLRDGIFPSTFEKTVAKCFPTIPNLIKSMLSTTPVDRPTAAAVAEHIQDVLGELTILSPIGHGDDARDLILLRVEVDHARDDALQHTMNQIRLAAQPGTVDIVQYGLSHAKNQKRNRQRDNDESDTINNSCTTIMEFALRSTTAEGPVLVSKLRQRPGIRVARHVSASTSGTAAAATLMASSQSGDSSIIS